MAEEKVVTGDRMERGWFSRTFVHFVVWLFLVQLNVSSGLSCIDGMAGQCKCTRRTIESNLELEIHCPSLFTLKIGQTEAPFMEMSCGDLAQMEDILPLMEGLDIGEMPVIKIKYCPVPSVSFNAVFNKMGAANVKFLSFASASWGNETLQPFHFDGLGELLHLELKRNGIEILERDIFRGVPKLEHINLSGNRGMQIETQVFESLLGLKTLEIESCGIKTLNKNTFSGLQNLTKLSLHRNSLETLEPGLFIDLTKVSILLISHNHLKDLPPAVFDGLDSLENITLSGNFFSSLPQKLFAKNRKLKKVDWFLNGHKGCIRRNCDQRIHVKLPFDMFHNSTIEALHMIHVAVEEIPESWLRGCKHLKMFTFRQGNVGAISDSLFNETLKIERIDLEGNGLSQIPNKLFSKLRNLKSIRLGKNKLKEINSQQFSNVLKLNILDLSNNQINYVNRQAFSSLDELEELNLSSNQIRDEDVKSIHTLMKLENLNLANNRLTQLDINSFFTLLHLQAINLSGNEIEGQFPLDYEYIQFLSHSGPVDLDLSNNRIESFLFTKSFILKSRNYNISSASKLANINIESNPIICDCHSAILKKQLESNNKAFSWFSINETDLICQGKSPEELIGLNILDIDYNKLNCLIPEESGCPTNCICQWNIYHNTFNINCSGIELDAFPDKIPEMIGNPSISIHLENNKISNLTKVFGGFKTASPKLWNSTTQLFLSNNHLKDLNKQYLPPQLKHITIDHNKMESISEQTLGYLYNMTKIKLGDNPYKCGCNSSNIYHFIKDRKSVIEDLEHTFLNCTGKNLTLLSKMKLEDFCENSIPNEVIVAIASSVIIVCLVCGLLVFMAFNKESFQIWLYSKSWSRWIFSEDLIDKDKEYDAFLSYAHQDAKFVENSLLDGLENPDDDSYKYRCLIHTRDWNVGEMIPEQIIHSVESSRRTIIVLTSDYIQSMWSKMEFSKAHDMGLQDRAPRVIIIVHGDLPPVKDMNEDLQSYIKMNTYLESSDPWFWQKLRYALPHRGVKYKQQQRKRRRTESIELMGEGKHKGNKTCDIV